MEVAISCQYHNTHNGNYRKPVDTTQSLPYFAILKVYKMLHRVPLLISPFLHILYGRCNKYDSQMRERPTNDCTA